MREMFATPVTLAHFLITQVLQDGDYAVDATAGTGYDTLFLAKGIGKKGHVFAFDIQENALKKTEALLKSEGLEERVTLFCKGHEEIKEYVSKPIKAAMFNLGYLPGGDHHIITKPATTIIALKNVLQLLTSRALVTIVVYRGHEGGEKEAKEILAFVSSLNKKEWQVFKVEYINRSTTAPFLIVIQKGLGD